MKNTVKYAFVVLALTGVAAAGQPVLHQEFDGASSGWRLSSFRKGDHYASARFLEGRLSLQDFWWGGEPFGAEAVSPQFRPCRYWKVEFDFRFQPVPGAKNEYRSVVSLLSESGETVVELPVRWKGGEAEGTLPGNLKIRAKNWYRAKLSLHCDDDRWDLELVPRETPAETQRAEALSLRHVAPVRQLRFEAVSGGGNMGVLDVDNLTVTDLKSSVPRRRAVLGTLENGGGRLVFLPSGRVELFRVEEGKTRFLGVLGVPETAGESPVFRLQKLRNDAPDFPRVDIEGIATGTEVRGSNAKVIGLLASDAEGKKKFLAQWTLFPEAARLRLYRFGTPEKARPEVLLPFAPAAGIQPGARFQPVRTLPTPGEPEQQTRAMLQEFTGQGRRLVAAAAPGLPEFFRDGRFRLEWKLTKMPWQPEMFCATLAFSLRPDDGTARREAAMLAAEDRIILELRSGDAFFLHDRPGKVRVTAHTANNFRTPLRVDVEYRARDYGGVTVAEGTFSKVLAPGEPWACSIPLELKEAGPVWMEATARHRYGADYARICTGVLPPAPVRSGRESRMGIAAYRGTVGAHTEVRSERQLLELMRRIGVRYLRATSSPETARELGFTLWYHNNIAGTAADDYFAGRPSWLNDPEKRREFLRGNLETTRKRGAELLEFTNEWNLSGGERKAVRAERYAKEWLPLLCEERNRTAPEIRLGGAVVANGDLPYLRKIHEAGMWDKFDVLVFHASGVPRAPDNPSDVYWNYLKTLVDIRKALREFGDKPIYCSEFYAPTAPNTSCSNNERSGAEDLALMFALGTAADVKNMMYYRLDDIDRHTPIATVAQLGEPQHRESYFGLVRRDWVPKASLWSYAAAARFFDRAEFKGDVELGPELFGLLFDSPQGEFAVLWNRREGYVDHEAFTPRPWHRPPWQELWTRQDPVVLPADRFVTVTDVVGRSRKLSPVSGKVTVPLTGAPVYVKGAKLKPVKGYFSKLLFPER